jgi:serine protease Do
MASSKLILRIGAAAVLLLAVHYVVAQRGGAGMVCIIDSPADEGGSGFAGAGYFSSGAGAGHASGGKSQQGQGYLGIQTRDVNDNEVAPLHLKDAHGAEITMVDHDGPAGKAGLREHDVVLSINGVTVEGEDQLRKVLHDLQPGRSVSLNICRNGSEQMVNTVMANRSEVEKQAWDQHWTVPSPSGSSVDDSAFTAPAEPTKSGFGHSFMPSHLLPFAPAYTGATVDAMGSQLADYFGVKDGKGLLVHDVEANSPAATAGLRAGDVVTKINGAHVGTEKDWTRALHDSKGHPVSLTVVRERKEQMLTMVPDSKKRSSMEQPAQPRTSSQAGPPPVMMMR